MSNSLFRRILSSDLLYLSLDTFNLIANVLFILSYLLDVRNTIIIIIDQQISLHGLEASLESFHLLDSEHWNTAWRNLGKYPLVLV